MFTSLSVILIGITTGVLEPILTISTWSIFLSSLMMYSSVSSSTRRASPPDRSTSLTSGVFLMYAIHASISSLDLAPSVSPASLLLVQCLQYIEHWSVMRNRTLSGYLCVSPGAGESASS